MWSINFNDVISGTLGLLNDLKLQGNGYVVCNVDVGSSSHLCEGEYRDYIDILESI